MNRALPDAAPTVSTKSVVTVLATTPVGPPGTETVSGTLVPSPRYRVETSVPLSATHQGEVGSAAIPQPFTRFESTVLPPTPVSDCSTVTVYEFAAWMFLAMTGAAASAATARTASGTNRRGCMDPTSSAGARAIAGMGRTPSALGGTSAEGNWIAAPR